MVTVEVQREVSTAGAPKCQDFSFREPAGKNVEHRRHPSQASLDNPRKRVLLPAAEPLGGRLFAAAVAGHARTRRPVVGILKSLAVGPGWRRRLHHLIRIHGSMMSSSRSPPNPQLWTPSRGISFGAPSKPPAAISLAPANSKSPRTGTKLSDPTRNFASFMHNEAVGRIHPPVEDAGDDVQGTASFGTVQDEASGMATSTVVAPTPKREAKTAVRASTTRAAAPPGKRSTTTPITWDMVYATPTTHPENDLPWKIPDDVIKTLQEGKESEKLYSHKLYRGPGRLGPNSSVTVHYCKSQMTMEDVCKKYFLNETAIGFDLEWEANATNWDGARANVSLIQMATPERIALFHVALFPHNAGLLTPTLKKIVEDPNVLKCGVWILGDFARLRTFLKLNPKGAMDLSHYHNLITFCRLGRMGQVPKRGVKLANQVEQVFGLPMFKGMEVRGSQWSQALNMDQVYYSATDAYAGVQLFAVYEHERKKLNPCPPRPPLAELSAKIQTKEADGISKDEEVAFAEAEQAHVQQDSGTVTLEDKILASKTTRTVAQTTETEETEKATLTRTTMATATITKTTFTTTTPRKRATRTTRRPSPTKGTVSAPTVLTLVTQDPAVEEAEEKLTPAPKTRRRKTTSGTPKVDASAADEDADTSITADNPPATHTLRSKRRVSPSKLFTDPLVASANLWAETFRRTHEDTIPKLAQLAELRTYKLWQENPDLSVPDIAALLRSKENPLMPSTVTKYITQAVVYHSELRPDGGQGLEVDKERFFRDVLTRLEKWNAPRWLVDSVAIEGEEVDTWGSHEEGNPRKRKFKGNEQSSGGVGVEWEVEVEGEEESKSSRTGTVRLQTEPLSPPPAISAAELNAAGLSCGEPIVARIGLVSAVLPESDPDITHEQQLGEEPGEISKSVPRTESLCIVDDDVPPAEREERSISPTPSETALLFALDREMGEATEKGEAMKMRREGETWDVLGVERYGAEHEAGEDTAGGYDVETAEGGGYEESSRSMSPTPSEMEAMMGLAGE
ncbi:ribonuclease H-like domain-containing protein [Zalerion maritima]|uniref:Ribonuclease H-like domain-containing protein n=1 Tax=Zalerion maritima TaxID=339359 RepID=A0AAD5WVY1_9PEZI|nr:ribonuclease H-like domain-containing protein [Zalerion maritima]